MAAHGAHAGGGVGPQAQEAASRAAGEAYGRLREFLEASTCVGAAGSATASCIYNATGNACENYGCVYTPSTSCYEQWHAAVGAARSDCPAGCDYARSSTEECSPLRLSTPHTSAALGPLPALAALGAALALTSTLT